MPDVTEVRLPGVGVRHEFTLASGERVGVLVHRSGRRELLVYDAVDRDRCTTVLHLSPEDTRTLADLLGASQVSEAVAAVQQRIEGLGIDWLPIPAGSRFDGSTIGDGRFRTRTGVSIVAIVKGDTTIPAPGPEHRFEADDVVVAVGTSQGLAQVRELLAS
ncbi:MAG: Potassium channel TrkA, possible KefG analog required for KefB activity [uncultured Acidimicrobiales bacterium]|uniref:Potassium channel TrkA, possible KefG analog required for KefB activity n=1 Tax=uncultured Acidimicrobiales bacterium TaxID=310071 RepID=A0A6J4IZZ4_9ACTN|nr:MAG: Potassium channel TrkA, possible KefG analog required for KefB activity [uncultured Acidimicrobiales bacterium]